MNRERILKTARQYLPPALVLALIVAFYSFYVGRAQTEFPVLRPQDGVLDVRDVDFSSDVFHLVNKWDYYPGRLLCPDAFVDPASAPQKDNDSPIDVNKGTYRLRILAKPNAYLTICSISIDYSTRIFVNGAEVRNIGFVSEDPAQACRGCVI